MLHSTSNTYQLKREILSFSYKISRKLLKPSIILTHSSEVLIKKSLKYRDKQLDITGRLF